MREPQSNVPEPLTTDGRLSVILYRLYMRAAELGREAEAAEQAPPNPEIDKGQPSATKDCPQTIGVADAKRKPRTP